MNRHEEILLIAQTCPADGRILHEHRSKKTQRLPERRNVL
jgi:hypothetical protein